MLRITLKSHSAFLAALRTASAIETRRKNALASKHFYLCYNKQTNQYYSIDLKALRLFRGAAHRVCSLNTS